MKSIIGNFIVETRICDTPSGRGLMTMSVKRLIETGLPLSEEEQEQLRYINEVTDHIARMHGAKGGGAMKPSSNTNRESDDCICVVDHFDIMVASWQISTLISGPERRFHRPRRNRVSDGGDHAEVLQLRASFRLNRRCGHDR
jgi:hypothetical protein